MFTETNLRKIKDFSANEPVLSLYLNTEPSRGNAETHRLRMRSILKDIPLEQDINEIEKFFNYSYDWSGRSVAVFSCAPAGFFQVFTLAIPVRDFVKVGSKAAVEALEDLLMESSHLGVALVDKQGARLFHFHLGELVDQQGVVGDQVKQVKSGSASSAHGLRGGSIDGSRSVKETVARNMREVIDFAVKYFESRKVRRIMIGGSDDNIASFRNSLPKSLQSLVVRTFAMSMTANEAEVLNKVMQAIQGD